MNKHLKYLNEAIFDLDDEITLFSSDDDIFLPNEYNKQEIISKYLDSVWNSDIQEILKARHIIKGNKKWEELWKNLTVNNNGKIQINIDPQFGEDTLLYDVLLYFDGSIINAIDKKDFIKKCILSDDVIINVPDNMYSIFFDGYDFDIDYSYYMYLFENPKLMKIYEKILKSGKNLYNVFIYIKDFRYEFFSCAIKNVIEYTKTKKYLNIRVEARNFDDFLYFRDFYDINKFVNIGNIFNELNNSSIQTLVLQFDILPDYGFDITGVADFLKMHKEIQTNNTNYSLYDMTDTYYFEKIISSELRKSVKLYAIIHNGVLNTEIVIKHSNGKSVYLQFYDNDAASEQIFFSKPEEFIFKGPEDFENRLIKF